ncbi:MAG TPA: M20 family metallopeptidase [Anaerolineae bacterium]|nr:M20 family metallopeptidase [Ardenticatenia bacterium]HQZ70371.1 M20 family metallopeptidase [Anaerolineae bacterium]HRA20937.1 M20 family metallopeptidase [Anaerolineae bacterium]
MPITLDSATALACALVRLPSVNPDGDLGTGATGEGDCARFVAGFLADCGAEVTVEDVVPGRPNVIGRFPTRGSGKPRILFAPHTDTVGVGGMTIAPFGGEVRDGRLWGRGASDTKGPMAAMLWALRSLGAQIADLPVEVHFAGFMAEESDQKGSRHFAARHDGYALALVGEPTGMRAVHKHNGCLWAEVITRGVAAHAATPEQGVNAITRMMPLVAALDGDFRRQLVEQGGVDDLLGPSTLNIGTIQGGTRGNIVPDRCVLGLDIRFTPQLRDRGGATALLEAFVRERDAEAEVRALPESPPLDTPADNPFLQQLVRRGAALDGAPWFCDGAYLAAGGIPAVAIGPGSIAQAHTEDEWISVAELEAGARFFEGWLRAL